MKAASATCILLSAAALYLVSILWAFLGTHFIFEFFYSRWLYAESSDSLLHWLRNITAPNYTGVSQPMLGLLWNVAHTLFGFNQMAYIILNIGFHCLNTFLIFLLMRHFFLAPMRLCLMSALFFLTTSISWPTKFEWYAGMYRHACLFYYLLGLLAFLYTISRGKGKISVGALVFYSAGFLTYHDVLSFPLMIVMMSFCVPHSENRVALRQSTWATAAVSLLMTIGFLVYVHVAEGYNDTPHFDFGWHSVKNLIAIPYETFAHFLIPRPLWGLPSFTGARMIPTAFFALLSFTLLYRYAQVRSKPSLTGYLPLTFFAGAWILITALPYLSVPPNSSAWAWVTRYFYFPSVGICIIVAIVLEMLFCCLEKTLISPLLSKVVMVGVVGYFLVFGTTTTILRGQQCRLIHGRTNVIGQQEAELTYGLFRESAPLMLGPGGHVYLTTHGAPLSPARLRVFMEDFNREMTVGPKKCDVILLETERKPKDLDGPYFQISYTNGKWGKITSV